MANYLFSVVAAAVFVAFICAAAPEGKGVGKFVGFTGALIIGLIALSPLAGGVDEWMKGLDTDWEGESQISAEESAAQSAEYLAYSIAQTLTEIYGLELEDISVLVYPKENTDAFAVEEVQVFLPTETKIDTAGAADTLTKLFSCTVSVEIA